jgi:tRNA-dihydrouridine synthase A
LVRRSHRLGIDDKAEWDDLLGFIDPIAEAGCRSFIVHARAAWLKGLSPKENRNVPPLRYELVYKAKATHPDLDITINGGIENLDAAAAHLEHVNGAMLGRAAYQNPYLLAEVDTRFCGAENLPPDRETIIERLRPYVADQLASGTPLHAMTRHILGLYNGLRGARAWRRHLSENGTRRGAGISVLDDAMAYVTERNEVAAA